MVIMMTPYGYCQCGCGQKTRVATCNDKRTGEIKGIPVSFVRGHHSRLRNPRPPVRYENVDGAPCVWIPLTYGEWAIIDEADLSLVGHYTWMCSAKGYAITQVAGKTVYMHALIHPSPGGLFTDHADGVPLNNRRYNLRTATRQQNKRNSRPFHNNKSGVSGVQMMTNGHWLVRIGVDYKKLNLGTFTNFEDAKKAREAAEEKYFGEFRRALSQ